MIQRLTTLYELQLIDDLLDELEEQRGDLPLAVNELNSQIKVFTDQIDNRENEKEEALKKRNENDSELVRLKDNLTKFKSQLYQVRNNKEYDALTKEIDSSEEKTSKLEEENVALEERIEQIKVEIQDIKPEVEKLHQEREIKETELKKIIKTNEKEEVNYTDKRAEVAAKVRKSDYNTYMRIRKALNGKAVVTTSRAACTGCHNVVPPQRQLEIRQNKRIYTCESCGRMLVSPEIAEEVEKTINF